MSCQSLVRNLPFSKALSDRTAGNRKILRRDYLGAGVLPVVDQGASLVAGYTNDESAAYRGPLPVIVFGDHTRVLKYVDFPFAIGADGAKVLVTIGDFEPRYLYYYLLTQQIPSRGYSRHFRLLRETSVRWVPRLEQRHIVGILDQANRLCDLRAKANAKAGRILPALLVRVLGSPANWHTDPCCEPLGELASPVSGATPSKRVEAFWQGSIPWVSPKDMKVEFLSDSQDHVSEAAVQETNLNLIDRGSALVVVRGMILAHSVPLAINLTPVAINQDLKALVPRTEEVTGTYLWAALTAAKPQLKSLIRTAGHGTRKFDTPDLMEFRIPRPDPDQIRQVSAAVETHRQLVERRRESALSLNRLFTLLLNKAFDGSLTAAWREAHPAVLCEDSNDRHPVGPMEDVA